MILLSGMNESRRQVHNIYKIVVAHQTEKIWMNDRTTVQGATFNMRGLCLAKDEVKYHR